eukprot:3085881-Pleurochrysis_carterae.AAC.1
MPCSLGGSLLVVAIYYYYVHTTDTVNKGADDGADWSKSGPRPRYAHYLSGLARVPLRGEWVRAP